MHKYIENKIICADARNLTKYVKPDSIDLTVTSPPYRNAIDYTQHVSNVKNSDKVWMRGSGDETTKTYLDTMEEIFDKVFKVTKSGGFCCIVIGDEVVNGKLIPLPSLLLSRLVNSENDDDPNKWNFRDMIIWHKVTSGRNGSGNRFGVFIQSSYPRYYRANIMHEYILILQKRRSIYDDVRVEEEKIPKNRIMKRDIANSIWNIAPVPPKSTNHPAPFPEQIPWRLTTLLTKHGDIVLDPMNGSGQTTKIAHNLGRRFIGLDIRSEYVIEAEKRLTENLKLSEHLFPVYHREEWSSTDQSGYFDTIKVDFTSNIPIQYKFAFKTESDKTIRGLRGVYTFYKNSNKDYLSFIIESNGKHTRLTLGNIERVGDILHDVFVNLPKSFTKDIIHGILDMNRQPIKACLDILLNLGYVNKSKDEHYKITRKGLSVQKQLLNHI